MNFSRHIVVTVPPIVISLVLASCCPPYSEEPVSQKHRDESVAYEPLVIGKARNPELPDRADFEGTWAALSWAPGAGAVSHDIYLSDNFDNVNNGTGDAFRGNQSETQFIIGFKGFTYPDGLIPGKTYYWRIDEVNEGATNSPRRGDIWCFTIAGN